MVSLADVNCFCVLIILVSASNSIYKVLFIMNYSLAGQPSKLIFDN